MKNKSSIKYKGLVLPLIVEKGIDGFYIIECPILEGCFTQGKTMDELIKNIDEAVQLHFEEEVERGEIPEILVLSEIKIKNAKIAAS